MLKRRHCWATPGEVRVSIHWFLPHFFKLFNKILIFNEKGRERYGLLHTPQCDKPCHLHLKRGHTWPSLCLQSLFYSVIHCTYAVLLQKNPEKVYMRLKRGNPQHAWTSWKKDFVEQPLITWQSQFFGFWAYFLQAFQWRLNFQWVWPGKIWTVTHTPMW